MKLEGLKIIDQFSEFLSGTQAVAFTIILDKDDCYRWIQAVLYKFHYRKLGNQDKGVLIRYLMKTSGYSRQQITRLMISIPSVALLITTTSPRLGHVHHDRVLINVRWT